jgi:hypothetical protein
LALIQVVGFLGIRGRVSDFEGESLKLRIRLGIKQQLGANTPFPKDHKSRVDGDPS